MQTPWEYRYAQRTQRMKKSTIRELLKLAEDPQIISFGGGMPAPEVFPTEKIAEACDIVLKNYSAFALQYGSTEGYTPLREMIVQRSERMGINVTTSHVMVTSGSQQALDLLGKIFINHGDKILVESPTYLGALQAWNAYGAEYVVVPSDEHGMVTEALEEKLRTQPKFMYVLPNFQNPTGTTISLERRMKIIEMADRYGVPIIEDDPYGQLRFEGEHLPAVTVLDNEYRSNGSSGSAAFSGNVIYLSTFSKILAPGLRLAWIIAPPEVISKLIMAKQGTDLHTATFNQFVAYEVGKDGFIDQHVKLIREVYTERRNVMLDSLEEFMPKGVTWTHPEGGLFLWATLPEGLDTTEILAAAIKEKVAYVPGESFHPNGGGQNTLRLNFSMAKPERIATGIERLARVFANYIK